jgi:hypothetical protein
MTPGYQNERYEYRVELIGPEGKKVIYKVARSMLAAELEVLKEHRPALVKDIGFTGRRFCNDP